MIIYKMLMAKYQRLFINEYQISTKDYVRNYQQIMQNKPNFGNDIMSANIFTTEVYEEYGHSGRQKTKPIQTLNKANQTQFFVFKSAVYSHKLDILLDIILIDHYNIFLINIFHI